MACSFVNLACVCYMARVLAFRARNTETKFFHLARFFLLTAPGYWAFAIFIPHRLLTNPSIPVDIWYPNNDHKTIAPAAFFLSSLFFCLYGILKAVSPAEYGVGLDWTATVFAALGIALSLSRLGWTLIMESC